MAQQRSVNLGMVLGAGLVLALLGAGPALADVTTGYDKGFFIKSDAFEAHFGTRMQLQYSGTRPDTFMFDSLLGHEQDQKVDNELNIRRFKFFGIGTAFDPSIKWKFQFDMERFKPGGGQAGNIRLEEAFVDITSRPWTQIRVGQQKVPFGYEKMISSGKFNLVDRSIVHSFFGVDQEPAVDLFGQSFGKKFRYDVAVSTGISDNHGFSTRNDVAADGGSDFRYMGRVTWEPLDPYVFEQGAVSSPERPQLSLQLAGMLNRDTIPNDTDVFMPKGAILPFAPDVLGATSSTFPAATSTLLTSWSTVSNNRKSYSREELEAVAAFKYRRYSVEAQAIVGQVDPELKYLKAKSGVLDDLTFDNTGLRLQAGVFVIPTKIEIVARYALVTREATAQLGGNPDVREEIDLTELRAGINWYFSKHDWKWQTDIGQLETEWKLNGTRVDVPVRSAFVGPPVGLGFDDKVIQNNPRKDWVIQSQFQLQF